METSKSVPPIYFAGSLWMRGTMIKRSWNETNEEDDIMHKTPIIYEKAGAYSNVKIIVWKDTEALLG